ncbi:PIR Superfamily Protein [Plasmodium ovale wallikeri]|uniref:PIR Superfamily Protein n=1 Tax=Plasmodium ovale wallikeri TaxID=864142 RepID=A0A1A9AK75_PLAOA|nr:PIR Superfamily Protein [Plasmodium ovale wallikeri]
MDDDYDIIPNSASIRSYNILDERNIIHGSNSECTKLEKQLTKDIAGFALCMSFTGNIKNYKILDFFEKLNNYKCRYLNLWVHDRLSKFERDDYSTLRKFILEHWAKSPSNEECSAQFVTYINNYSDYIRTKRLYDYALNYDKLHFHYEQNSLPCTPKHAKYITKSLEMYDSIRTECKDTDKQFKPYCMAYKEIKNIYPNDQLLILKCKSVSDEKLPGIGGEQEETGKQRGPSKENEGFSEHGRHRLQGELSETYSFGSHALEVSPSSDSHKAIASTVPILGISSIFFLLYKFTGLGSMARNFLRTKGINRINSQEELTHELLENTYDDNAYPDVTETYIGYQAT